jgi:hypothetical protein
MRDGGVEAVVALSGDEVTWRPFGAGGRTLHGHAGLRAYFAGLQRDGVAQDAHAYAFEPVADDVVLVSGALRVQTAQGLQDRQLFWLYRVCGGRLVAAESYTTRAAAVAAARDASS